MKSFSERIGAKPVRDQLQMGHMDDRLRNELWNVFSWFFVRRCYRRSFSGFHVSLWHVFLGRAIDELPGTDPKRFKLVKDWFFRAGTLWYEVYDFLEFCAQAESPAEKARFKSECNLVLERELSAYRFVGDYLAPVTNALELSEIDSALNRSTELPFAGVHTHLEEALRKLSHRKEPDYRNSIKESISAVESLAKIISDDPKGTLGGAVKKIEKKIGIHKALKDGFSNIYGYTSDEDGIRHAMMDERNLSSEDARFMLVACSAFVNYLIEKANKAGLLDRKENA